MKKKFYQVTDKSLGELKVETHEDLWKKVKGEYKGLSSCVETVFTKAEGDNKFDVIMSTDSVDRHGEVVEQNWDLKPFKKNSVFLDSHNYNSIEHILGKVNKSKVKDNKLQGEIEFMLDNPKGLLAYNMAKGGFLNATSVGFIPLEFSDEGQIMKSELLELSAVSVPANPEALLAKKKKAKKVEKKVEDKIVYSTEKKSLSTMDILNRIAKKKEERKKELLNESLAVIRQLQSQKVDSVAKRRKMVNRVVKQLLKVK